MDKLDHITLNKEINMAKFILLYSGGSMPESEAEVAAVMKAWEA